MVPLRVAVLTSHSVPGIEELLRDPNRGAVYELAAVISSEIAFARWRPSRSSDHPAAEPPLSSVLGRTYPGHATSRRGMFTDPLPDAHPETARRRLRRALRRGQRDAQLDVVLTDDGKEPLFLLGAPYPVAAIARDARAWGDADLLNDYAELHRRWMIRATWGPMFVRAMEFLAAGTRQDHPRRRLDRRRSRPLPPRRVACALSRGGGDDCRHDSGDLSVHQSLAISD